MTRRPSTRDKMECFDKAAGQCHICKQIIDPEKEKWEAEHLIPHALGGTNKWPNLRPVHKEGCHPSKTRVDVKSIAKAVRMRAKHIGAELEKQPIVSRGFAKREKVRTEKPPPLPRREIYK